MFNCATYSDDKTCPKKQQFIKDKAKTNTLRVLMVGCWGVYCWDGDIKMTKYKPPKDTDDKPDKPDKPDKKKKDKPDKPDKKKKDKKVGKMKEITEVYGSRRVVKGMVEYTNTFPTQAVFLAGDNVYSYNVPKERLLTLFNKGEFPSKKQYKTDHTISGQDIMMQLHQGFLSCLEDVKVPDFFIAVGNHDVASCYDLHTQLEFAQHPLTRYRLPGVYYNVIYPMHSYSVNFIVIDTNMFDKKAKNCEGTVYDEETLNTMINSQIDWVIKSLKDNNCLWNIIIGHIPYKANPHKIKDDALNYIKNKKLDLLFNKIKKEEKCPKVQVYFCADEHNQQFLYDNDNKMTLVVAGSGGTALDKKIIEGDIKTMYSSINFGFVSFVFKTAGLEIAHFDTTPYDSTRQFESFLDSEGNILRSRLM